MGRAFDVPFPYTKKIYHRIKTPEHLYKDRVSPKEVRHFLKNLQKTIAKDVYMIYISSVIAICTVLPLICIGIIHSITGDKYQNGMIIGYSCILGIWVMLYFYRVFIGFKIRTKTLDYFIVTKNTFASNGCKWDLECSFDRSPKKLIFIMTKATDTSTDKIFFKRMQNIKRDLIEKEEFEDLRRADSANLQRCHSF
mmetsp:Transcript_39015/g.34696  ORF Transcript_39015/g.34696 Transcript_39015/m.34696 type:complete len:196 (-) Transcript_39015:630-1217(-)